MATKTDAASMGTIWAGFKAAFPALPVLVPAAALLIGLPVLARPFMAAWLAVRVGAPLWLMNLPVGAFTALFSGLFMGIVALQLAPRLGHTAFVRPAQRPGGWLGWAAVVMVSGSLLFFLVSLASMLLLIPGLVVSCMLYAAVPAAALESLGPTDAFSRSSALTQDYRFGVFGMQVVLYLPVLGASIAALAAIAATRGGAFQGVSSSPAYLWIYSPIASSLSAIATSSTAIAFYIRRTLRTSGGAQSVAEVFS